MNEEENFGIRISNDSKYPFSDASLFRVEFS